MPVSHRPPALRPSRLSALSARIRRALKRKRNARRAADWPRNRRAARGIGADVAKELDAMANHQVLRDLHCARTGRCD